MSTIRCGSKIFQADRIVAVETRTEPRAPGWYEGYEAQVLVDCGDKGYWFGLTKDEWQEFQAAMAAQTQRHRSQTEML